MIELKRYCCCCCFKETTYYGQKGREEKKSEPGNSFSSEMITIVVFGSVICLVLLLAVVREMYQSCRFPIGDIHVEDTENVYAVIDDVEKLPESPCLCFS